ncbi:MAG: FHA domain-containing protein [Methylacidiphilales bacterium]|nr:FHA domain-containing protein [Candidatus Methylacidiphilales bacterium]
MAIFKFRNLHTGQATPIPPGEFTVGRADDAYVHIEDNSVSRRHAKIFNLDDAFFIEDTGSANGTATCGVLVTERTQVTFGDVVHIGSVPFRVDPEVAGEAGDVAPSAGLRSARKSSMRRDTERLPLAGEIARVVETLSPERLIAPPVDETKDGDAEELNAITIREPEPLPMEPMRLPRVQPGLTPLPESKKSAPAPAKTAPAGFGSAPVFQSFKTQQTEAEQLGVQEPITSLSSSHLIKSPEVAVDEPVTKKNVVPVVGWGWWITIFLAGLGTGLLLGLIFAKLFLDLGGKAASLP